MAAPTLVQSARGLNGVTLGVAPTPGNMLVLYKSRRDSGAPNVQTGFTDVGSAVNTNSWDRRGRMMYRTVQSGDTTTVAYDWMLQTGNEYFIMEFTPSTVGAAQVADTQSASSMACGGSMTPTAAVPCVLIGGGTIGSSATRPVTPDAGVTEVFDYWPGYSPHAWFGYRTIASPSGAYTVGGTITWDYYCGVSLILYGSVPLVPTVDFSGTPLTGESTCTTVFTDLSTNTPTSWLWDFGDGNTSTSQNPTHQYTAVGTYDVSLTATNADGSGELTKLSYVVVTEPDTYNARLNLIDILIKPYTYHRRAAPQFGARFQSGDPDYNSLTFWQHWAQTCWIGGMGQETWQDDSMYDEAVGVDTSLHDRAQLSRDIVQTDSTWELDGKYNDRYFCIYLNELYCLQQNGDVLAGAYDPDANGKLYKYDQAGDDWTLVKTFTGELARSIVAWNGRLLVGTGGNTDYNIHTFDGSTWTVVDYPVSVSTNTRAVHAMMGYRDRLYVAFGGGSVTGGANPVWRLKTDWTWDGSTEFYESPGQNGVIHSMAVHQGYLYMMTRGATLLRSDGNNTFEIWTFDNGSGYGAMTSYDGRLFISVSENDGTDVTSQSVLYALSGSAMTQLKRWGKVGRMAQASHSIALHDGRLYYGASDLHGMQPGFGIAVYDATEDAHSIFAANSDTTTYVDTTADGRAYEVNGVFFFAGRLWISVGPFGVFKTAVSFRDYILSRSQATYDLTGTAETNGGWLVSSTFDGGNAIRKMWRRIRVEAAIPSASTVVELDYSLDNGTTWVETVLVETEASGIEKVYDVLLSDVFSRRLKYRLRLQTSVEDETPVVRSVVVSYMMMPDPQWLWEFVVPVSERMHLLDDTTAEVDTEAFLADLRQMYREQRIIDFVDIEGSQWEVLVYGYDEAVPQTARGDGIEGEVRLTLLEALEGDE